MSRYATPKDLVPDAHCVLGTMLRPFCLGHRLLLEKIESPYLLGEEGEGNDLAVAVFICAQTYANCYESFVRGEFESGFKSWLKKLKPRWWQPTRFNHDDETGKFWAYLEDGNRRPPVERHEVKFGLEITSPEHCLIIGKLVAAGFRESDVLEKYLPAAWYDYYTACEMEQASNVTKPEQWRRVFWTKDRAEAWERAVSNA